MDYGRTHVDGANMLADALKPHGGIVMWRAFVYELVKLGVNKNNLIISGMGGVNTLTPPAFNRRVIIEAQ
jgi:hypothetical protein